MKFCKSAKLTRRSIYSLTVFVLIIIISCKSSEKQPTSKSVLFSINENPVTTEEFEYVYTKNNFNRDSTYKREDVKDYLSLFINFKLKVREAEDMGLNQTEAFKQELEGYRKQLAKPYLTENNVTDQLVREAYERLKEEVNASHILVSVNQDAEPADTLKAYNEILKIKEKAVAGEDFAKLAKENSEDPTAKMNGGNLGYFSALQMVYPFEDAAFKTEIGKISMPVRTRFGYHIIKVHNRRPSQGKVKVAHIMIRYTEGMSAEDSINARNRIYEIHDQLKKGGDWNKLVAQFTEDAGTASKGGSLPAFGTGSMIPSFEEQAFALKTPGDYSTPFQTPYGFHIIKLEEKIGLEPFDEIKANLKTKVSKDSRSELNKQALIKRLKKENAFKESSPIVSAALKAADTTLITGEWKYKADNPTINETLFTINKKSYTVKDFYDYVMKHQTRKDLVNPKYYMQFLYNNFVEENLLAYEESQLEQKYNDYRLLYKEYREGILLFQLMDEKVWSKAIEDSVGLKKYFEENKERYKWQERANAKIYKAQNKEVINELQKLLAKGLTSDSIFKYFNQKSALTLQMEEGLFEKGINPVLDKVKWEPGSYTVEKDQSFYYVIIKSIEGPALKQLDEVKGLVISDYQNFLEKKWIDELRKKYVVKVNEAELEKVYKKFSGK